MIENSSALEAGERGADVHQALAQMSLPRSPKRSGSFSSSDESSYLSHEDGSEFKAGVLFDLHTGNESDEDASSFTTEEDAPLHFEDDEIAPDTDDDDEVHGLEMGVLPTLALSVHDDEPTGPDAVLLDLARTQAHYQATDTMHERGGDEIDLGVLASSWPRMRKQMASKQPRRRLNTLL